MTKHTPTPWTLGKGTVTIRANADGDKKFIATTRTHGGYHYRDDDTCAANAAHIVRCVNAHDALVAALQAYRDAYDIDPRDRDNDGMAKWCAIQDAAVAALRDAGGADEGGVAT